jgi:hypothetical protein
MTLPEDSVFIKDPYITPKIVYAELPEANKGKIKQTKICHDSDNHIRIEIGDWVMPGIVLNLNWIEKD